MTPKELDLSYQCNKKSFHDYINAIKKNSAWDIYTIINPTLVANPYASIFPKMYFEKKYARRDKFFTFLKYSSFIYIKNFYLLFSYLIAIILYKVYYRKKRRSAIVTIIDTFGLIEKITKDEEFNENYFTGIHETFQTYNSEYTILLRPYGIGKNPFRLIQFFKIINQDKRDFVFEYELLKPKDFFTLLNFLILYPFKTLRLLQKETTNYNTLFNQSLLADIKECSFDSLTRYILGQNLAKIETLKTIYSWSEFQVIERSFNYAIRNSNDKIKLVACQFYINDETYFNTFVDDLDYDMRASPHVVLVNGKRYLLSRQKVNYATGVSLRYKNIFNFHGIRQEKNILLLGSYIEQDTKYMLSCVQNFEHIIFKNHPAVKITKLGAIPENITISNDNIYQLFENTKLVIATASGTPMEAVACGISVIIIASQETLTANPLVEYGKGKIWDIAFNQDDVKKMYNKLIEYRHNNRDQVEQIAGWYKANFFIEPTEENIIKVFNLDKDK